MSTYIFNSNGESNYSSERDWEKLNLTPGQYIIQNSLADNKYDGDSDQINWGVVDDDTCPFRVGRPNNFQLNYLTRIIFSLPDDYSSGISLTFSAIRQDTSDDPRFRSYIIENTEEAYDLNQASTSSTSISALQLDFINEAADGPGAEFAKYKIRVKDFSEISESKDKVEFPLTSIKKNNKGYIYKPC